MTITKKAFIGILSLTAAVLLAACSGNTNQGGNTSSSQNTQGQTSQSAQNQTSQSSAASSSNQPSSSSNAGLATNLDGRYQATDHDGDQHVLEINGTTGTWTETEVDGDKEIKRTVDSFKINHLTMPEFSRSQPAFFKDLFFQVFEQVKAL